jgi:hypothetical protein
MPGASIKRCKDAARERAAVTPPSAGMIWCQSMRVEPVKRVSGDAPGTEDSARFDTLQGKKRQLTWASAECSSAGSFTLEWRWSDGHQVRVRSKKESSSWLEWQEPEVSFL